MYFKGLAEGYIDYDALFGIVVQMVYSFLIYCVE